MKKIFYSLLFLPLIAGCSGITGKDQKEATQYQGNEEIIMATLYNFYSAEYKALALQAFNLASERISRIAGESNETSSMAIVVDIDETILDNSPYQAMTVETGESYPAYWDEWCNLAKARAIPGAVEFLQLADSLGFAIFYISNRKFDAAFAATYRNLDSLGFPQVSDQSLMLREARSDSNSNPSDKEPRRSRIESMGYNIVMLAGDNLGDFFRDESDYLLRDAMVDSLKNEFGRMFIVLPNAMYGNWPASIGIDGNDENYRKLIREMTEPFGR